MHPDHGLAASLSKAHLIGLQALVTELPHFSLSGLTVC